MTRQNNSMDMSCYLMAEYSVPVIMFCFDCLKELFVLLFQAHLLTDITTVHATARCVDLLRLHTYKNFNIPSVKL